MKLYANKAIQKININIDIDNSYWLNLKEIEANETTAKATWMLDFI